MRLSTIILLSLFNVLCNIKILSLVHSYKYNGKEEERNVYLENLSSL